MAKFEKGHTKLGGRQKGSLNKSREPIRALFAKFVLGDFDAYVEAMEKIRKNNPEAYVRAYNDAVKHVLPSLQSIMLETPGNEDNVLSARINSLAQNVAMQSDFNEPQPHHDAQ